MLILYLRPVRWLLERARIDPCENCFAVEHAMLSVLAQLLLQEDRGRH